MTRDELRPRLRACCDAGAITTVMETVDRYAAAQVYAETIRLAAGLEGVVVEAIRAERERCASLCEAFAKYSREDPATDAAYRLADSIRART